jgi:hypothetical protein
MSIETQFTVGWVGNVLPDKFADCSCKTHCHGIGQIEGEEHTRLVPDERFVAGLSGQGFRLYAGPVKVKGDGHVSGTDRRNGERWVTVLAMAMEGGGRVGADLRLCNASLGRISEQGVEFHTLGSLGDELGGSEAMERLRKLLQSAAKAQTQKAKRANSHVLHPTRRTFGACPPSLTLCLGMLPA